MWRRRSCIEHHLTLFLSRDLDHNLEITLELIANEEINIALGIARWSSSAEAMTDIHAALDMGTPLCVTVTDFRSTRTLSAARFLQSKDQMAQYSG